MEVIRCYTRNAAHFADWGIWCAPGICRLFKLSYGWREKVQGDWTEAVESSAPSLRMPRAKSTQPLHVGLDFPISMTSNDRSYLYDFGQEKMGGLILEAENVPQGARYKITLGEELINETTILSPMRTGNNYSNIWHAGNLNSSMIRLEHHEYMEFRYASIEPINAPKPTISRWTVNYPFDDAVSTFLSSDDRLNAVYDLCRQTIKWTTLDTFTDSNTRERLPYEADMYITGWSYITTQTDTSLFTHSALHNIRNPTWPTEWRQILSLIAHLDYMQSGGSRKVYDSFSESLIAQTQLPCLSNDTGLIDFTKCTQQTGGFGAKSEASLRDIVDWPQSTRDGYDLTDVNTVVNSYAYGSLMALADIEEDDSKASWLQEKASAIRKAMNDRLWNITNNGLFVDGLQSNHSAWHAQVFPVAFGIAPERLYPSMLNYFRKSGRKGSVYAAFIPACTLPHGHRPWQTRSRLFAHA